MAIRNTKLGGPDFTDGEVLYDYDLDDTNDILINNSILTSELSYRILQSNNVWTQGPNIIVDEFTDSNGSQNTVNSNSEKYFDLTDNIFILPPIDEASTDTTSTTASGSTSGWTNEENVFDGDDATYASISGSDSYDGTIGKTFSAKTIESCRYKVYINATQASSGSADLQYYNGTSWVTITSIGSVGSSPNTVTWEGTIDTKDLGNIQGLRINVNPSISSLNSVEFRVFTLEYGNYTSSNEVIVDSNTTSLDGNENGFVISIPDATFPTNTTISATIGDGTNTLTKTAVDSTSKGVVIGNGTAFGGPLSSGTLQVTFTLETTDSTVTPTLPGYAIGVIR